jgi:hypothetical protein
MCTATIVRATNRKSENSVYFNEITRSYIQEDRLCDLVVSIADYKHRCPGSDSRALLRIFLMELGLERGPLSLVIG